MFNPWAIDRWLGRLRRGVLNLFPNRTWRDAAPATDEKTWREFLYFVTCIGPRGWDYARQHEWDELLDHEV
jgi:hypothetical protein